MVVLFQKVSEGLSDGPDDNLRERLLRYPRYFAEDGKLLQYDEHAGKARFQTLLWLTDGGSYRQHEYHFHYEFPEENQIIFFTNIFVLSVRNTPPYTRNWRVNLSRICQDTQFSRERSTLTIKYLKKKNSATKKCVVVLTRTSLLEECYQKLMLYVKVHPTLER
eukprot:TRINITY_DN6651_c0_g1_i9.p2 TRINITY_DN6651_c0_g1~~TRINITY_DN6651_c0_g1_i9.p2  ORF type:complete len:164 (-),score=19.69 TRINITY_DN6651_c0_g1_i9:89-580(-)